MEFWGQQARLEYEAKYTAQRNYEMIMDVYQHVIRNYGLAHERLETGLAISR
jgi:alkyl hydroperoxide reductase subunit AhpC